MPAKKEKNVQQLSIRLPDDIYRKLSEMAKEQGIYLNQLILQMIKGGMSVQLAVRKSIDEHHEEIFRDAIEIEKSIRQDTTVAVRNTDGFAIEKIGEGMVKNGYMTIQQVNKVLQLQKEKYSFAKKFGEIAVELHVVDPEKLEHYLSELEKKSSS